jgi:hypothetical protein
MRRLRNVRRSGTDLLTRPPAPASPSDPAWLYTIIDPVAQLAELDDLRQRGVISADDLERQKAKVLGR